MKRVVITGVTSFLGINLAKSLLQNKNDVYGIVRPSSKNIERLSDVNGLNILKIDLDECADENVLADMIRQTVSDEIDVWVHFSWDGIGSEGRSNPFIQERNIENAKKSYKAAVLLGCRRFLFSGSQAEYGDGTKAEPSPKSEYGKAKLAFGNWAVCQSGKIEFIHLRIYSIYGIGDHENSLVNSCIRTFSKGDDMVMGPCTQIWNYMDIRDCSDAISMIIQCEKPLDGVFEIASAKEMQLSEYVRIIWSICGKKGRCLFGQRNNNAEGAADLKADVTRLKEIGYEEKFTFEEGIRNIVDSKEVI